MSCAAEKRGQRRVWAHRTKCGHWAHRDRISDDRLHLSRGCCGVVVIVLVPSCGENTWSRERGRSEWVCRIRGRLGGYGGDPWRNSEEGLCRDPHGEPKDQRCESLTSVCEKVEEDCLEKHPDDTSLRINSKWKAAVERTSWNLWTQCSGEIPESREINVRRIRKSIHVDPWEERETRVLRFISDRLFCVSGCHREARGIGMHVSSFARWSTPCGGAVCWPWAACNCDTATNSD